MGLKIQFLNGGLANQAFQYIFARHFELSHPDEPMLMDDSYFACNTVHNGYELEKVFGIRPHMLSELFEADAWQYIVECRRKGISAAQVLLDNGNDIMMVAAEKNYEAFNPFHGRVMFSGEKGYQPEIQDMEGNVYYHGYWIDKGWFMRYKDIFMKEFMFPALKDDVNRQLMENISGGNSLSLHVRRGDYVDFRIAYESENYRELIEMWTRSMGTCWDLYVFSDDIEWCRANSGEMGLHVFKTVTFVQGNTGENSYVDMQLMSRCKGMILSNSAFCYLAALLNERKTAYLGPDFRKL